MACYWGHDTKANRRVYGVIITLMCIGKLLIAAALIGGYTYKGCFPSYRRCLDQGYDAADCTKTHQYCRMSLWLDLIVAGIIVWLVGVSCTAYMCCCSEPPDRGYPPAQAQLAAQGSGSTVPMIPQYPHGTSSAVLVSVCSGACMYARGLLWPPVVPAVMQTLLAGVPVMGYPVGTACPTTPAPEFLTATVTVPHTATSQQQQQQQWQQAPSQLSQPQPLPALAQPAPGQHSWLPGVPVADSGWAGHAPGSAAGVTGDQGTHVASTSHDRQDSSSAWQGAAASWAVAGARPVDASPKQ